MEYMTRIFTYDLTSVKLNYKTMFDNKTDCCVTNEQTIKILGKETDIVEMYLANDEVEMIIPNEYVYILNKDFWEVYDEFSYRQIWNLKERCNISAEPPFDSVKSTFKVNFKYINPIFLKKNYISRISCAKIILKHGRRINLGINGTEYEQELFVTSDSVKKLINNRISTYII